MARGELDTRLKDFSVSVDVARQVQREHDCEREQQCPVCGYRPTNRQPLCPSREIALALLRGRRPRWNDAPHAGPSTGQAGQAEQAGLFEVSTGRQ